MKKSKRFNEINRGGQKVCVSRQERSEGDLKGGLGRPSLHAHTTELSSLNLCL